MEGKTESPPESDALFVYSCIACEDVVIAEYCVKPPEGASSAYALSPERMQQFARSYFQYITHSGLQRFVSDDITILCDQMASSDAKFKFVVMAYKLVAQSVGVQVLDFLKRKFNDFSASVTAELQHRRMPAKLMFQDSFAPIFHAMFRQDSQSRSFNCEIVTTANAAGRSMAETLEGLKTVKLYTEKRLQSSRELLREAKSMKVKAREFRVKAKKLELLAYLRGIIVYLVCGLVVAAIVAVGIGIGVKKAKDKRAAKALQEAPQQQQAEVKADVPQNQRARPVAANVPKRTPRPTSRFRLPVPK